MTPAASAGAGSSVVSVSNVIGSLSAGVYHYRIVATNAAGASYGVDATVQTLPEPAAALLLGCALWGFVKRQAMSSQAKPV